MLHDETAVVPDIYVDDRIPLEAYLPDLRPQPRHGPGRLARPRSARSAPTGPATTAPPRARSTTCKRLAARTANAIHRIGLDDAPWAPTFTGT